MTEFWITLGIQVAALDEEQAREIANDLKETLKHHKQWKTIDIDVLDVENTGVGQ